MMDPDVYRHVRIAIDFLDLVVDPSLDALHRLRNEWAASPLILHLRLMCRKQQAKSLHADEPAWTGLREGVTTGD